MRRARMLLLGHLNQIVVWQSVNELVQRINAGLRRKFIYDQSEVGILDFKLLFFQIKVLAVLIQNANINPVMDRDWLFLSVPVGAAFLEFYDKMDLIFAICLLGVGGGFRPAVIDRDVLKKIFEQVLKIRRSDFAKIADQIKRDRIRRPLKGIGFHEFRQGLVDLV